jgi:hypothetical protein
VLPASVPARMLPLLSPLNPAPPVCCPCSFPFTPPQRKRRKAAIKKARYEKSKAEAAEYHKLLMQVGSETLNLAGSMWGLLS